MERFGGWFDPYGVRPCRPFAVGVGGGTRSSFNAIPNWSGGVPSASVAGVIDVAHAGAYQINVANAVILGDLTLGDLTAEDAGGFELTGSTITFNKVGGNASQNKERPWISSAIR